MFDIKRFLLHELANSEDPVKLLSSKLDIYQELDGPWNWLCQSRGFFQNSFHSEPLHEHLFNAYKIGLSYSQDPLFALICLFHDIGKIPTCLWSETKQDFTFHKHEYVGALAVGKWLRENNFTFQEASRVRKAIQHHQFRIYENTKDKTIKKWLLDIGSQTWQDIRILRLVDRMANKANQNKPIIYKLYIETDNRINKIAESILI